MPNLRNFSIIAHIDHGKSTLADRLIQRTLMVEDREFRDQILDNMDIERERGITIKSQAVTLPYTDGKGEPFALNLIDTPGHVDFSYEVSRALASCEGVLLVVDASQGVEAQTVANLYAAMEHDLEIIPVINKIDLPSADVENVKEQIEADLGLDSDLAILCSAKLGTGIDDVLEAVTEWIPAPGHEPEEPLTALIFDAFYDSFRGTIVSCRIISGSVAPGDTVTLDSRPAAEPLSGFKEVKPVVFSSLYPMSTDDFGALVESLEKYKLNDASLTYQRDSSAALGLGFRCGFLGLLHLEIVQERLEREYGQSIILTMPTVEYHFELTDGQEVIINNPLYYPDHGKIEKAMEPYIRTSILIPERYMGAVMELCLDRRGESPRMNYPTPGRMEILFDMPLAEILYDFYDRLKTVTQGYGSFDYDLLGYRENDLVKLDILVNEERVDALSQIVHRDRARARALHACKKLKEEIPRHLFKIPIQGAIGGTIVARSTVSAFRKDVTAKCYGGDVSRKRKLLEKQKKGKKRMKMVGAVAIPQSAFVAVFKSDSD